MINATRGSGALQVGLEPQSPRQDRFEQIAEQIAREHKEKEIQEKIQAKAKRRDRAETAKRNRTRILTFSLICVVFVFMAAIVVGNAKIASMTLDAGELKTELKNNNKAIEELEMDISMATDLQNIKQVAKEELEMGYPKDYQIFPITLKGNQKDSTASAIDNQQD